MYLRLVRFAFANDGASKAQAMANDLIPAIKELPGCLGAVFFGGEADGESGLSVLWDTRENADAAAAVIGPRLQQHLAGNVKSEADIRLFPVVAS